MNYPEESICPKWGLHKYLTESEDDKVLVEVCEKCGKRVSYNKVGGQLDEKEYLKHNYRLILQPHGETKADFEREYRGIYGKKTDTIVQAGDTILEK